MGVFAPTALWAARMVRVIFDSKGRQKQSPGRDGVRDACSGPMSAWLELASTYRPGGGPSVIPFTPKFVSRASGALALGALQLGVADASPTNPSAAPGSQATLGVIRTLYVREEVDGSMGCGHADEAFRSGLT